MRVKIHRNTTKRPSESKEKEPQTGKPSLLIESGSYYGWTMKNTFVLMAIACPLVLAITRMTMHIDQTMFALLENKNIQRKS